MSIQEAHGTPQELQGSSLTEQELQGFQELQSLLGSGNLYSVLSLEIGADGEEVKQAYYALSRRFHPDRFYRRELGEHTEMVEQVFAGINHAYNTLKDPELRRRHEKDLVRQGGAAPGRRSRRRSRRSATDAARGSSADSAQATAEAPPETSEAATSESSNEISFDINQSRAERSDAAGRARAERARAERARAEKARRAAATTRPPPAIERFKRQIAQRLAKARRNYNTALEDIESEAWIKAASGLYLAMQYDPKNEEYKRLYDEVRPKAAQARASQFISIAENAEGYRNIREAIANYESAVECDPPTGLAFFRLGQLLQVYESDTRGALKRYRQATEKEPENTRYRMALADLYLELDMRRNAHREYQAILQQEPRNADAKAGLKKSR